MLGGNGEHFPTLLIHCNAIIDLDLHVLAHVQKLHPVFARFGNLRNSVLLRVDFLPDGLIVVHVHQISLLYDLELWADPNWALGHRSLGEDVAHFYIWNLDGPLLFRLFFFGRLLLVLGCLFSLFCLLLESCLHLMLIFRTHEGLNDAGGSVFLLLRDGLEGLDLILGVIKFDLFFLLLLLRPLVFMLNFKNVLPIHLPLLCHVGSDIFMVAV